MEDVKRPKSKEIRNKSIAEKLAFNNEDSHLKGEAMPASQQVYRVKSSNMLSSSRCKGETMPASQQVYRVKVVTCFLRAGVPLRKYNHFRELLKENSLLFSDGRHMSWQ